MDREPRSELEILRNRQNEVTDQSLDSTRRIRDLAQETTEIGTKTLLQLNEQGEQLDGIERNLDQIEQDRKRAEGNLSELEKSCFWYLFCECCGSCQLPCYKKSTSADLKPLTSNSGNKNGNVAKSQPRRKDEPQSGPGGPNGGHFERITNDDREDEMEENFNVISDLVGTIRNIALDMGNAIEGQNQQLDRINVKAETNLNGVKTANARAAKLL